jgi:site-specific DNA-methyltransferase (adenine-specific)
MPDKTKTRGPSRIRQVRVASEGWEEWRTPLGRLLQQDCLEALPRLRSGAYELIFADPPFNIGKVYGQHVDDLRTPEAYLEWCHRWLDELIRLLAPGGSLFIYNLPRWNVHLAHYLEGRLTFRHWIAVDMKYSLPVPGRLYPAHYSLLYHCKGPTPNTFNPPRQPMVTCRHCGMELKDYGGYKSKLNPLGFNLSDVWTDLSPVRHKRFKRTSRSANQLPVKMMDRILDTASKPGDRILDPFAGSGTTLVTAELKSRKWTGIEIESLTPIVDRFRGLDVEADHLDELQSKKNRLFTDEALALREASGHALDGYRILVEHEASHRTDRDAEQL